MKNSKIAELRAQQDNVSANNTSTVDTATVNTNTSNNMDNVKSVEIVLNIVMTSGELKASTFAKVQNKKPYMIMSGRSCWFNRNSQNGSAYGMFRPLPNSETCSNGRNNAPVVIFHMEDGSSKILDAHHTHKFWTQLVGVENLDTERVLGKIDIPQSVMTADQFERELRATHFRAISIKFDRKDNLFTPTTDKCDSLVLVAKNAVVSPLRDTVGDETQFLGIDTTNFFEESKPTAKMDLSRFSKSAKRRDNRRAQAAAARASVETAVEEPLVMDFGGGTVVCVADEAPAVEVETPVASQVDMAAMIQQAVAAAIAPLTQEIASLRSELKAKDAEIEALKAAQAQPVAEPTPVVEEVAPEPISEPEPEVVEETTEKETVEEEVTEAPVVEEAPKETMAQRARRNAAERKARKSAANALSNEEYLDLLSTNFND